MMTVNPSARLKVKRDTFYVPEPYGGVYFRNNTCSFRMEGEEIDLWIEQLLPMWDGEQTMAELTDGLPEAHASRVYEIAAMLYANGFLRDVSEDRPHSLSGQIVRSYASEIEFLEQFGPSAAYRFQTYRQAKVLAIGSGPLLLSSAAALLESGIPELYVLITDTEPTDRCRLREFAAHVKLRDSGVTLHEASVSAEESQRRSGRGSVWNDAVMPFDTVMYVSRGEDFGELLAVQAACREQNKRFVPAVYLTSVGIAGPFALPGGDVSWESAWRRVHRTVLTRERPSDAYSSTAGAMLANIVVFELLKTIAGAGEANRSRSVYLLDLETLEGGWHSFVPHPVAAGVPTEPVDAAARLKASDEASRGEEWLSGFARLTSPATGIFHTWDEGELIQLPLSQCRVQAADPLSEGPAERLQEIVGGGMTHEEARREAALAGVESYVRRWSAGQGGIERLEPEEADSGLGIGAGETAAEALARALHDCLGKELRRKVADQEPAAAPVWIAALEDAAARFYYQALSRIGGTPIVGIGEHVFGMPVVWVGAGGRWYGGAGLTATLALREALREAVLQEQNRPSERAVVTKGHVVQTSSVYVDDESPAMPLDVPACDAELSDAVQAALQRMQAAGKRPYVFDMAVEPFLREQLAGVFGVALREEVSR